MRNAFSSSTVQGFFSPYYFIHMAPRYKVGNELDLFTTKKKSMRTDSWLIMTFVNVFKNNGALKLLGLF